MSIAFQGAADLGNNGGSGTFTASYTVGSGANRLLTVIVMGANIGTSETLTVTYGGVAMTLVTSITSANAGSYTNRNLYFYYLLNPPSGPNNVVVTGNAEYVLANAADYTGGAQSGQPNSFNIATNAAGGLSLTVPVTATVAGCWIVVGSVDFVNGNYPPQAGTNLIQRTYGVAFGEPQLCDSNGVAPVGTAVGYVTWTNGQGSYSGQASIGVAFAPSAPQQHFPLTVADTSTVIRLGFTLTRRFPLTVADTSTVSALGFAITAHFPLNVADSSTVVRLGFEVTRRFPLNVADTSTVNALGFTRTQHFPPNGPGLVAPYCGQNQQTHIAITRPSLYHQEREEGCWVQIPYAQLYPPGSQGPGEQWLPPPVKQTDIYTAQQTWPL